MDATCSYETTRNITIATIVLLAISVLLTAITTAKLQKKLKKSGEQISSNKITRHVFYHVPWVLPLVLLFVHVGWLIVLWQLKPVRNPNPNPKPGQAGDLAQPPLSPTASSSKSSVYSEDRGVEVPGQPRLD